MTRKWVSVEDIKDLLGENAADRLVEGITNRKRQRPYTVEVIREMTWRVVVEARSEREARQKAEIVDDGGIEPGERYRSRIIKAPRAPQVAKTVTTQAVTDAVAFDKATAQGGALRVQRRSRK